MRRLEFLIKVLRTIMVLSLSLPLIMASCGDGMQGSREGESSGIEESHSPVPIEEMIEVTNPDAGGTIIRSGNSFMVEYDAVGDIAADSVQIWFDGDLLVSLPGTGQTFEVAGSITKKTGMKELRVTAIRDGLKPQSVSRTVTVLSDIEPSQHGYRVVNVFPHDNRAYTQGLLYHNGYLYEGTGLEGESSLRKVEIETGEVLMKHNIDDIFFGEGITIYKERIYQLTWTHNTGFIYDLETFRELGRFYYNSEGWGLTTMGDTLVMSDGSNKLYLMNPNGFTLISVIEVYDSNSRVDNLNELEYIKGEIWANIFMTDKIARIDPYTGKVLGYIDLRGIMPPEELALDGNDVLNGIAWDTENERVFVTGKNWSKLFEIDIVPPVLR
jgi:glutaminyl-peptide cyclotransferase